MNELQSERPVPILAITADDSRDTQKHAYVNGIFNVVNKPIDPAKMVKKILHAIYWFANNSDPIRTDEQRARNLQIKREEGLYAAFGRSD